MIHHHQLATSHAVNMQIATAIRTIFQPPGHHTTVFFKGRAALEEVLSANDL